MFIKRESLTVEEPFDYKVVNFCIQCSQGLFSAKKGAKGMCYISLDYFIIVFKNGT